MGLNLFFAKRIGSKADTAVQDSPQISLADVGGEEVCRILRDTDLNTFTPIEAMNLLFELQKKARA